MAPHVVEPDVFHGTVIIHQLRELGHRSWLVADKVPIELVILGVDSERSQGLFITAVRDLVFPCQETGPILVDRLARHLVDEGQISCVWWPGVPGAVLGTGSGAFGGLGSGLVIVRLRRGVPCMGNIMNPLAQTWYQPCGQIRLNAGTVLLCSSS